MVLVLSVVRCPDHALPEQRQLRGGECVLGRGSQADWQFDDRDSMLSRKHCVIEFAAGGWQLRDTSSNGTFVNGAAEPVGQGAPRPLFDGDRIRLGAWEIECRVTEDSHASIPTLQPGSNWGDPMAEPLHRPLVAPVTHGPSHGLGNFPEDHNRGPLLPDDLDLGFDGPRGGSMPDHTPSIHDSLRVPQARTPDLIPEDWDKLLDGLSPGNTPPAPDPFARPFAAPADPFAPPAPPPPPPPSQVLPPQAPPAEPFPPAAAAFPPDPFPADPFPADPFPPRAPEALSEQPFPPFDPPAMPPPAAQEPPPFDPPPPEPAPSVFAEPERDLPRPPPVPVASVAPAPAPGGLDGALALVLEAAGLPPAAPGTDAAEQLRRFGAGLAAAIAGVRALLIARDDVRREFRIEQTMMRAAGNNPVRFAATDQAALAGVLSPRGAGADAIGQTFSDLTRHQIASIAATQSAARAMLEKLAPGPLEEQVGSGGIMPGAREKKLWEAYRKLHEQVTDQFDDDFDSAFGRAFAKAYEETLRGGGR
ncbi:type VI secretion system-associated FHA domain protein TagH [Rhodovarius crocodyli]|uniref:Type VI secretion system-associated FHA domain protein TagH n=1 Tax=Rhodovarius crocodyli TaxID=1979269 RepID=A0A437MMD4_9PROT|nr:type VI secretion system-associated FHA domain protein TagH [Rhodovarius crocodyli]RVT98817.1 type VI secretion system-associated FHA domain protein TagH [Rhodovarius crocodyli]